MKELRYWTTRPRGCGNPGWLLQAFLLDAEEFRPVWDEVNPEYVIATDDIYVNGDLRERFLRFLSPGRLIVFVTGECLFPDMNIFDYATAFDRSFVLSDRIVRRPYEQFFPKGGLDVGCTDPAQELARKTGFCNFVYGNALAHPRRDQLFYALSRYKRVDSLGRHLNNCGNRISRRDPDWMQASIVLKSSYKFSIAAENAVYDGYVTEKLPSSLLAHTVPIYFGDPKVAEDYNPQAFIDANALSDEELVEAVRRVDTDDDLWRQMVAAPPMTPEQVQTAHAVTERYRKFWQRVFATDVEDAKRAPAGTYPNGVKRLWWTASVGCATECYSGGGRFWQRVLKVAKKHLLEHVTRQGLLT